MKDVVRTSITSATRLQYNKAWEYWLDFLQGFEANWLKGGYIQPQNAKSTENAQDMISEFIVYVWMERGVKAPSSLNNVWSAFKRHHVEAGIDVSTLDNMRKVKIVITALGKKGNPKREMVPLSHDMLSSIAENIFEGVSDRKLKLSTDNLGRALIVLAWLMLLRVSEFAWSKDTAHELK